MTLTGGRRTVIVGDGSLEDRSYLQSVLQAQGYSVRVAGDGEEVLGLLQDNSNVGLVLLDLQMPIRNGVDTLCELRRRHNGLPVIMMSRRPIPESVLKTIEQHKAGLLEKQLLPDSLAVALQDKAAADSALSEEPSQKAAPVSEPYLLRMENLIRQVGCTNVPVLLQGETGAGKEVLARRVHAQSRRSKKPFVKINCAALPSELVESELFGYERGAFSGAFVQSQGLFETANEGTILLDEIGDMDVRLQAKLLQVLQDGEFRRVGGRELVKVDVRIMAATHQDLRLAIQDGRFREDLYYRLNVVSIRIPPLRERQGEILGLAEQFLQKYESPDSPNLSIPPMLADAMLAYDWPGNVRELENTMRKYLILRDPVRLAEELKTAEPIKRGNRADNTASFDGFSAEGDPEQASALARAEEAKRAAESEAVLAALEATRWNRKKAAEMLRVDYKALLYKMKKLGIGSNSRAERKAVAAEAGASYTTAAG